MTYDSVHGTSYDLEEEAKRVKSIALSSYRDGQRLEATFRRGTEKKVLHYRSPRDLPLVLWVYGSKLYLWSVRVCEQG